MRKTRFINILLIKEAFFCMVFAFAVLGVVSSIGLNLGFFDPFKNAFKDFSYLDLYYSEKLGDHQQNINEDIILVNIDRRNRKEIASVLLQIQQQEPKVIGLDVIFKDLEDPVWDQFLAENLKNDRIIASYVLDDNNSIASNKRIVERQITAGYSNFSFASESAVIRNFQGTVIKGDTLLSSFAVAVAKKYTADSWGKTIDRWVSKERPINYTGDRDSFLVLEYADIMEQEGVGLLKDKIVLLGYMGSPDNHRYDMEDKHFTPMNNRFAGKSPPDTFGVIIHANIIQMILERDFISVVPSWVIIMLTIVFTFLSLCYFIFLNKRQLASYILRLNVTRLLFMLVLIWISLALFKYKILLKTASIIAVVVFSTGLIGYYKKGAHYLHKKFKWEGYFYHD